MWSKGKRARPPRMWSRRAAATRIHHFAIPKRPTSSSTGSASFYQDSPSHSLGPYEGTKDVHRSIGLTFLIALILSWGASLVTAQDPVTRPAISEEVSPVEEVSVSVATPVGRTANGVVRKPPGQGPFPAVVVIHGGFGPKPLSALTQEALSNPTMTRFLAAGFVTVIPTYHSALVPQAVWGRASHHRARQADEGGGPHQRRPVRLQCWRRPRAPLSGRNRGCRHYRRGASNPRLYRDVHRGYAEGGSRFHVG